MDEDRLMNIIDQMRVAIQMSSNEPGRVEAERERILAQAKGRSRTHSRTGSSGSDGVDRPAT